NGDGIAVMPEAASLEQFSGKPAILLQRPAFRTHDDKRRVTSNSADKLPALGSHELNSFRAGHTRELTGEGHPFAEKELTIGDLPGHRLFLPEELIEDNCKLQNADLKFAFAICNSLPPLVCFVLALTHLSADYINKS